MLSLRVHEQFHDKVTLEVNFIMSFCFLTENIVKPVAYLCRVLLKELQKL